MQPKSISKVPELDSKHSLAASSCDAHYRTSGRIAGLACITSQISDLRQGVTDPDEFLHAFAEGPAEHNARVDTPRNRTLLKGNGWPETCISLFLLHVQRVRLLLLVLEGCPEGKIRWGRRGGGGRKWSADTFILCLDEMMARELCMALSQRKSHATQQIC